mmetsp:Transcript_41428/g.134363  ORF Transcript_41428/g.134363 Transcript_41428/m.134363 type:complete len:248 (+) Transcript_41428:327-1070(+)
MAGSKLTVSVCVCGAPTARSETSNEYRKNWSTATPRRAPSSSTVAPILIPSKTRRRREPGRPSCAPAASCAVLNVAVYVHVWWFHSDELSQFFSWSGSPITPARCRSVSRSPGTEASIWRESGGPLARFGSHRVHASSTSAASTVAAPLSGEVCSKQSATPALWSDETQSASAQQCSQHASRVCTPSTRPLASTTAETGLGCTPVKPQPAGGEAPSVDAVHRVVGLSSDRMVGAPIFASDMSASSAA